MTHPLPRVHSLGASRSPPFRAPSYRCAEALAADGGPVVPKDLPDGTGGVEAFGQQQGSIEEEEGSCAIDEVLKTVDAVGERSAQVPGQCWTAQLCLWQPLSLSKLPQGTKTEGEATRRAN